MFGPDLVVLSVQSDLEIKGNGLLARSGGVGSS